MIDSLVAYFGFLFASAGLLSLVRPLRFLGIRSRKAAGASVLSGLVVAAAALAWPIRSKEAPARVSRLDEWMPVWHFGERHTIQIAASPDDVFAAIRAVRADEIFLFRTLIAIRRCGRSGPAETLNAPEQQPLLDVATQTTFIPLADEAPRELVLGTIVAAPRKTGAAPELSPELFRSALPAGVALATMNFLVTPRAGGELTLSTETRVFANDSSTARRFAVYWRVIHPGSDIIRRSWLRAIRRRAEAQSKTTVG
ncbi:MAG: hypothetical protein ABR589_10445 [Chthoniobacterales bacterium]